MTEQTLENNIIKTILEPLGYDHIYGPDIAPEPEVTHPYKRESYEQVILTKILRAKLIEINPDVKPELIEQTIKKILDIKSPDQTHNNETFHNYLTDGIELEYLENGNMRGQRIKLIDFKNPENNQYNAINQYTIIENNKNKRPDIILYINGLPLVVIELKNPTDEKATLKTAYNQLQTYKHDIPTLFNYNSLLVVSDGLDAKYGALTAPWNWFMKWKTKDGIHEDPITEPQIITMSKGLLKPETLLEIIKDFTVFSKEEKIDSETGLRKIQTSKKISAYHQYYAVKKAVKSTLEASSEQGDGRGGVFWHTQGSGKSLSMVFYSGKVVQQLNNPTIVVITDRNDLDDQLFGTFTASNQLLRQTPVQAESRKHLRELLNTSGGGIVFSTIQKFYPSDDEDTFPTLSERKNIVVITDEAHRSQYGFSAKTQYITDDKGEEIGTRTRYGLAKYLRDALPRATYLGFTGTPIEKEDRSTPAVFGNYIDIYDVSQAVEDGATVKIYYESRLAKIKFLEEYKDEIDDEVASVTENEKATLSEQAKAKWARVEGIIGNKNRIDDISKDIIDHFSKRQEVFEGKGMIVCMSRRIAVEMYEAIVKNKPEWHDEDKRKGNIKIIMTSSSSDPVNWQMHNTSKLDREMLAERFKDPDDELKLVIVIDMWLTGFDVPCLSTMYIDKPMKGHTLMQAIARVNRVYKDKEGGLIVDYIGIATELKKALATYSESGGKGSPTLDINEAIAVMKEKYEIVKNILWKFDYKRYFNAETNEKLKILLEAQEFILSQKDGKKNFIKYTTELSKAFALVVPNVEAMKIKEEVGFFQAVKARLIKFEPEGTGRTSEEIETAIKQIIDKAVVSEGVIDLYDAAGIKNPDISILSDEFLQEVKDMKHKNTAIELLRKLLEDEITTRSKRNIVRSKKLSEMLQEAIRKYQNNLLTSVEVIDELIQMAKQLQKEDEDLKASGLSVEEIAFYDALIDNESAKKVLGDDILREISTELVEKVRRNASIDWTIRESARAKLRVLVKRTLRNYNYPPDKQKSATEKVLKQAELFTENSISN
ncbi:MAG: type I restriction-modification system restriction subunit [candidate division WS6 bacterium 34_10]|uniref:Type I restriction enzyme endonuclease subunit n=1 Tax=candidate division WS6 bacterium 34_10 TaxID=1641389 RepID=A0A101HI89_9BACT|nr:MAG: type I restriction-modification system restriction subunit [candidate division WS6 bacterium 34_10]